ncbi:hypothetical protein HG547_05375 [Shewanella sp. DNRA4]|uniref:hypothetical protein n=1 Tax=Shewanella TaxID=22 RepID=UPI00146C06E3|nr:hypothetical protein [Shewanella sp. DNRA4]NMD51065.1 hypothetical protein [Shewanella sp. DNRA4]
MQHLDSFQEKTIGAINLLHQHGYVEAMLTLTFAAIDQMAWLTFAGDESNGAHFKDWVKRYIDPDTNLDCTADDLWAARCGLVHTATAESRHNIKATASAKKIFYTTGPAKCSVSKSSDVIFIDADKLVKRFICSWLQYRLDIASDPKLKDLAINKANKILSYVQSF